LLSASLAVQNRQLVASSALKALKPAIKWIFTLKSGKK